MSGTDYSGNGVKPTLPIVLINDGEDFTFTTFMVGVMEKCIDWLSYLDAGGESVAGYVGISFTIVSGPLQTYLRLLADKAAKIDGNNTFTGNNSHQGTETYTSALYVSAGGYIARPALAVATNATTLTIDPTAHSEYIAEAWNGSGGELVVSLAAYAPSDNPEVTLTFHPVDPSAVATVGGRIRLTGDGSFTFRYGGASGVWKFRSACGSYILTAA